MKVRIQANAAAVSQNEILKAIPLALLNRIKAKNPHPTFQAYSIVQEGQSKPKELNQGGNIFIEWPRAAVQSVRSAIKRGLQFFNGHNQDNDNTGRPHVGRVVGLITKEIAGKLNQIAIGYFPNGEKVKDFDVCSIEADVITRDFEGGKSIAEKVEAVTGIALGSSARNQIPAFPGAARLATIQCFDPDNPDGADKNKNNGGAPPPERHKMEITFDQIKQGIKDKNIHPRQLFNEDEMRADFVFGKLYTEIDNIKKENETLKTSITEKETENKNLLRKTAAVDARDRLIGFLPEGATQKQKDFINKVFDPEKIEDFSDEGLKGFVENQINVFNAAAETIGGGVDDDFGDSGDSGSGNDNNDQKENADAAVESILTGV